MRSSTVRMLGTINGILGLIGSIYLAYTQSRGLGAFVGFILLVIYLCAVGEWVFMTYAVAGIMKNTEDNAHMLKKLLKKPSVKASAGGRYSRTENYEEYEEEYVEPEVSESNFWLCPKCGALNPNSDISCINCGYNK